MDSTHQAELVLAHCIRSEMASRKNSAFILMVGWTGGAARKGGADVRTLVSETRRDSLSHVALVLGRN